jgi:hypothetical protein
MNSRLLNILSRQQEAGFPGLAGSEVQATIRISNAVLNEAVRAFLPTAGAVRDLVVHPRAGNRVDVRLTLAKPSFLPPFNITLLIERQPSLPADPVLGLKLSGAGGLLRLAGPAITSFGVLPPGIHLAGDRVLIDLRILLAHRAQAQVLDHADRLEVLSDEGTLIVIVHARIRA